MNETDFSQVVKRVCKHPTVYTMHGTFDEAVIFLTGYAWGADVGDDVHHSRFTPFLQWLSVKFDLQRNTATWDDFHAMFTDDVHAMNELASLYCEYAETCVKTKTKVL